jgi:hypothetical protein
LPDISKINALAIGSVSKVDGLAKASILDIDGVAVPSAFTGLLDTYTGAAAGYSVRRLASSATNLMRIREDSGDTETDIGYDSNGDLDTAAIASHCGAANGFLVTWYDQSGNSNNATQSTQTKQPKIYNGSAVYQSNSKPAIYVDPTNANLAYSLVLGTAVTMDSIFMVVQKQAISGNPIVFYITGNSAGNADYGIGIGGSFVGDDAIYFDGVTSFPSLQSTTAVGTSQHLVSVQADATTDNLALDGTIEATGTVSPTTIANIFNRRVTNDSNRFEGYCQEMIIWDTDQSSNRTGIETDINGYFSIF